MRAIVVGGGLKASNKFLTVYTRHPANFDITTSFWDPQRSELYSHWGHRFTDSYNQLFAELKSSSLLWSWSRWEDLPQVHGVTTRTWILRVPFSAVMAVVDYDDWCELLVTDDPEERIRVFRKSLRKYNPETPRQQVILPLPIPKEWVISSPLITDYSFEHLEDTKDCVDNGEETTVWAGPFRENSEFGQVISAYLNWIKHNQIPATLRLRFFRDGDSGQDLSSISIRSR